MGAPSPMGGMNSSLREIYIYLDSNNYHNPCNTGYDECAYCVSSFNLSGEKRRAKIN